MRCPLCNGHTEVLETRGGRRRYECGKMHRFTTVDGEVVRVDQQKLARGKPARIDPDKPEGLAP